MRSPRVQEEAPADEPPEGERCGRGSWAGAAPAGPCRQTDGLAAALVPFLFNSFSFVNSAFCSVSTTFLPVPWRDQNKTLYRSPFLVLAQTFNLF